MNRTVFALRNVLDKAGKIVGDPRLLPFYVDTYLLARLERVQPDSFIVSYPKCGRTWLRSLLHHALVLAGHAPETRRDRSLVVVPGVLSARFDHDQGSWVPAPPALEGLRFDRRKFSGRRLLLLVRDPRDVLVSSWYHLRYRERIFTGSLSDFVRDDLVGIAKVVAFMNLFVEHRDVPLAFEVLRYEDLHAAPVEAARAVLAFLGLTVDETLVRRAVEASSFQRMQRRELSGELDEPWMKPGSADLERSLKVRRGAVGGFRDELEPGDVDLVEGVMRERLDPVLGYV